MKKSNSPLVRTQIVDRNGFSRPVWKRPDDVAMAKQVILPSVVPGSKTPRPVQGEDSPSPMQRIVTGLSNLFSRKEPETPIREQLQLAHPEFSYENAWMKNQDNATLKKVKDILDVPSLDDSDGWGRMEALKNPTPETIRIAHANREFLSDGRTHIQVLTEMAEAMGPENVAPDGRISNIEAHCEVAREFVSAAAHRTNISGVNRYVEAEGVWTAINEHPEMTEQIKKWAVDSVAVGHIFYLINPNKSREIVEIVKTLGAHPEQEEKIMDFARARGASFSQEAYEGFEELPDALEEGFL